MNALNILIDSIIGSGAAFTIYAICYDLIASLRERAQARATANANTCKPLATVHVMQNRSGSTRNAA